MTCLHCCAPMAGRKRKYCDRTCSNKAFTARRKADGRLAAELARRKTDPAVREKRNVWARANSHKYRKAQATICSCGAEFQRMDYRTTCCSRACSRGVCALPVARTISRVWSQGTCAWCGTTYLHTMPLKYCSRRCKSRMGDHLKRKRRGEFTITRAARNAIYERDNWTCQLCMTTVAHDLDPNDSMAATLDHIECQSWTLLPDHRASNLRLAHRVCNILRSDKPESMTLVA